MDEQQLKAILARELNDALGAEGGQLSADRRKAMQYYDGEPFGNEVDGRSQVVSLTVLEAVEWVLPALLRIFTASDKIANIEPTREEHESAADQATQYISHIFYRDNAGFMLLHDWFKDALLEKLGWVKRWWDEQKIHETNSYTGLTAEMYAALKTADVDVIDERSYPNPEAAGDFNEDNPAPGAATLYDCTLRKTRTEGRVRIENVPPEEVLVSRRAKRGRIPFLCHRREYTYSDLVELGYDADTLDKVPAYDGPQYNTERSARFQSEDDAPVFNERTDKAMRPIWLEESYIKVDYDGDGIAELRKICTAGDGQVILTKGGKPDIEAIDEVPLVPACPIPMPHKLVGKSLADLVMDLQLIKSTLVRQMLDNIYLTNNPRTIVEDRAANENTYDDILTSRPGGLVRAVNKDGIEVLVTPFVAEKAMQLVEYFDQTGEVRTGVSRHNQGLNPDDLNKTATGVSLIQQAAAQRVELIARIFAESVKELVQGILGLVRRHQQQERIIRVTGKWLEMDPRQWKNEMEVSVSVGLGTGNRDQILAHLMQILQIQQGIVQVQQGVNGPLVFAKNIYDVTSRLTENAGFKETFFADPTQPAPQGMAGPGGAGGQGGPGGQPPPNPEMLKAHGQLQIAQVKAQAEQQAQQSRLQADLAATRAKADLEAQLARERAQLEMELDQRRAEQQAQLEQRRAEMKFTLEQREIELRAAAGAYTSGPAPGAAA